MQIFPANPQWSNYIDAWQRFSFINIFKNTLVVVIGGLACQMFVSTLAAYSLARLKPVGGRIVMGGFLLTLMVPSIAYIVPLYTTIVKVPIINISLINSYWGLWLPYAVNAFAILIMKTFFESIPNDLLDAAKVDGASQFRVFWSIVLPLSRPILLVLVIVGFLGLWKDFLLPYLVLPNPELQPVTVRVWYMLNSSTVTAPPLNLQMAVSFLGLLPPLIFALLLQRYLKRGLSIGAVKG